MRAQTIKVLIADDHWIFRKGLRSALDVHNGIEIVGEACDGVELVEMVQAMQPDVVLTDIELAKMSGPDAIKAILTKQPHTGIIVLTNLDSYAYIAEMIEAGVLGYLLKDPDLHQLKDAIFSVYNNKAYYSNTISNLMLKQLAESRKTENSQRDLVNLTKTETAILSLICEGLTNKEIGCKLSFATRTVEVYRNRMMEKLGIHSPAALAVYAVKKGIYKI